MSRTITFIFVFVCMSSMLLGGIIHVPADQPTIQAGIDAAQSGDTVLVADSTYYENINFKGKAITVASHFYLDSNSTHIDSTIIDGSQPSNPDSGSVVYFVSGEDTNSVLCGFTITGGTGTYSAPGPPPSNFPLKQGGGILCDQSGPTIKNNYIIINNCILNETGGITAGGGISTGPIGSSAFIIIENNKIMNNNIWSQGSSSSAWAQGGGIALTVDGRIQKNEIMFNESKSNNGFSVGGGIRVGFDATVNIINNIVSDNSSISINSEGFAGGISNSGGNTLIKSNVINYNSVAGSSICYGAAIYFDLDNDLNWAVVDNNYISGNHYTNGICYGGAIGMWTSSPEIYNNIIVNNSADYGGALHAFNNSKPEIVNNTITGNAAIQAGGALYAEDATTHVRIMNSIFWNNTASGTGHEIDLHSGSTVLAVYSDIEGGWQGEENINLNPELVADSLSNDSPCIGAGILSYNFGGGIICNSPPEDFNGRMRPYPSGSDPDIGAWESKLGTPVGIHPKPVAETPKSYALKQNYPNPFNPTTTMEFALPHSEFVTLKIYNILGEEVATLVTERLTAGKYKYDWDAIGMASGVYFYRLDTDEFLEIKKCLLLK